MNFFSQAVILLLPYFFYCLHFTYVA